MEDYTIKTTAQDLKKGLISETESKLIISFIKARDKFNKSEDDMADYYKKKYNNKIDSSVSISELKEIKEELRTMPQSCAKVLLFRRILMKEDKILKN